MLGPVLFILQHINHINNLKLDKQIVTYANETCLLFPSYSWETVKNKAKFRVNKICHKSNSNKLCLNINKTDSIAFYY